MTEQEINTAAKLEAIFVKVEVTSLSPKIRFIFYRFIVTLRLALGFC
jgi:hypothetical protein